MPFNFPNSPSTNDTYTYGDRTWTYDGVAWTLNRGTFTVSNATIRHNNFTADGSTLEYTLSTTPFDENHTLVSLDGVVQHKNTYSIDAANVATANIVFTEAPDLNTSIDVIVFGSANPNVIDAASITTSNIAEGSNLYYTDARAYSNSQTAGYSTTGKAIAMAIVFGAS